MGEFKLKINVARFAAENTGVAVEKEGSVQNLRPPGQNCAGVDNLVAAPRAEEKVVVVPDRVGAFRDLHGLAVVGRTVNLETLVDIDRLFSIAKIIVANIQYIGGLSLLISFHDEESMNRFLELKNIWEPWFTKLDPWRGQTLPLEKVAWLKLSGIPLHLFESDVRGQIGEMFGKVLHVPKSFEEDQDLLIARVGVLVGHSSMIKDEVILKWKNRSFRIWIEEDHEVWEPDCLRRLSDSVPEGNPSSEFSPVDDMQLFGDGEFVETRATQGFGVAEKLSVAKVPSPHAVTSKVHGEEGCNVANINEEREFMPFVVQGCQLK
ncbi:hypothetical protein Hdeb2414_s0003g00114451 [Helianthus debilis subsp. tardiflorus]